MRFRSVVVALAVVGGALAATALVETAQAAAQRAAHPDFTGVWMAPFAVHAIGVPLSAGSTQWALASKGDPRKEHIPTLAEVTKLADARIAQITAPPSAAGGAPRRPEPPGLTAAGKAAFAQFDPKVYEEHDLNCYPFNVFDRLGGGLGALQIVQNPRAIMMATEINGHNFPRIIYLDGRSDADALPSWEGYSIGRWNGDTLHIVTTKIKGDYFNNSWPLSLDAKLVEDYRLVGTGKARKIELMQRIEDPENFTEALVRVSYLDWRPDLEVHDFPCEEGKGDQAEMSGKPHS